MMQDIEDVAGRKVNELSEMTFSDEALCSGNWSVIVHFVESKNPQYFGNRPWIVGGLLTLAVVGLINNASVIVYELFRRRNVLKSAFSLLVIQLAIADGMVSLFCFLANAIWNVTVQWLGGSILCRFLKFIQMFSLYSSTMVLTGLTVESCIEMTYPLTRARPQYAVYRAKIISVIAWSVATLCSIPQAAMFHLEKAPFCGDVEQCVPFGAYFSPWQQVTYTMSTLCVMFLIPFIIMMACFATICMENSQEVRWVLGSTQKLPKQERSHAGPKEKCGRCMYRLTRRLSLWATFTKAVVFVCCWSPYYTLLMADLSGFKICEQWITSCLLVGMASAVFNPLIYGVLKIVQDYETSRQLQRGTGNLEKTPCSGLEEGHRQDAGKCPFSVSL